MITNDLIPMTATLKGALEKAARALEREADAVPDMVEKYLADKQLTEMDSVVKVLLRNREECMQSRDVINGVLNRHQTTRDAIKGDPSGQHSGARL